MYSFAQNKLTFSFVIENDRLSYVIFIWFFLLILSSSKFVILPIWPNVTRRFTVYSMQMAYLFKIFTLHSVHKNLLIPYCFFLLTCFSSFYSLANRLKQSALNSVIRNLAADSLWPIHFDSLWNWLLKLTMADHSDVIERARKLIGETGK